jgi:hypothetical protein
MIELPNVTLFCISSNQVSGAIHALKKSMESINFGKVKLITHEDPGNLPEGIEFSKCHEIKSIHEYNYYCIYNLSQHIDTDYCLLVQPDGFVINPDKWDDDWFNYDYIGALWMETPTAYIDPWGKGHRVGNGGFSFRSKKLLDVPKRAYIHFDVNWGDFYKHMDAKSTSEDGNICVHNRHIYEALGCKFAPIEVAARFSHERSLPETQGIIPFGFHFFLPEGTKV